jgi:hypothetical protein
MSVTLNGTTGLVFNDGSAQDTAATGFGFKNRILNGSMVLDQRNAGASQTPTNGAYMLDRYAINVSQTSKLTQQQNAGAVTPPAGFTKYMGFTSSSAYSVLTGDYFAFYQAIEGLNVADFAWGTASAATVTLSFWVRSSLTGAFGGSLRNGTAARSYPFSYTINAANTWEQKSVTIAGDTSGTWSTDNGVGILVGFSLGTGSNFNGTVNTWGAGNFIQPSGSTSVVGTNGATFYITGVQLEKGSTTSFDYRPYGIELALCQRYFEKSYDISVAPGTATSNGEYMFWYGYGANSSGSSTNGIECWTNYLFKVQKRATVTVVTYDVAGNSGQATRFYTGVSPAGNVANTVNTQTEIGWKNTVAAGSAANGFLINWTASAEL